VLLGAGAAIVTGAVSYTTGLPGRECMPRMVIAMAVFFVIGLVLRGNLDAMAADVAVRRAEAEQARMRQEAEARRQEREAGKDRAVGAHVDLRADESEAGFNPGRVADFIRQELRSD